MITDLPNIQQLLDNHLFENLDQAFGNTATGDNWIDDTENNLKNKYAVMREYRNLEASQVEELVIGRTSGNNLGAMIITNVRLVTEPRDMYGKKYGARLETIIYNCCMNIRQSQLRGNKRATYEMNRDALSVLLDEPFVVRRNTIPLVIQTGESDFTTDDMDAQRIIIIIPTSEFSL